MKTNLLLEVVRLSLSLSGRFLSPYGHLKSPHKFTQPQLMTCLVLRAYLKTTYRGVIDVLAASQELRESIGLKRLPHYSTLKRFGDRSSVAEIADAMFAEIIKECAPPQEEMAVDSTGMQSTSASAYFQTRSGRKNSKYVKLSLAILCGSLFPCSLVVGWGPKTDRSEAPEVLEKAMEKVRPKKLYADAGYDADWIHAVCREHWNVESFIPPSVTRKDGTIGGVYRPKMAELPKSYGKRWHIESFMSGLKRTTGSALNARIPKAMFAEAALRVITYALRL